ncbi:P-loop containing nucleoside triphosphate hydrolase protein, partial [Mycena olivaceomarginata]
MDQQVWPAYIATASLSFLIGHAVSSKFRHGSASETYSKASPLGPGQTGAARLRVLKFLACVILVILELKIATSGIGSWQNVALCITYAYAMLLASLPLVSRGLQASIHLNTVLLVSFGSYAYRDLFPLATFTLVPQDLAQGWLLWAKIVVLAVAAVVIPLSTPRPADGLVFSSLTYSYLDSSILKSVVAARKQDGLTSEKLPALADYDRCRISHSKELPRTGSSERRCKQALVIWPFEGLSFVTPLRLSIMMLNQRSCSAEQTSCISRKYGAGRSALGLGGVAVFRSILSFDVPSATRQRAQAEGIMVQLLFAHSLRIRMNSETKDSNKRNLVGRINNLSTSDVANLTSNMDLWILGHSDAFSAPNNPRNLVSVSHLGLEGDAQSTDSFQTNGGCQSPTSDRDNECPAHDQMVCLGEQNQGGHSRQREEELIARRTVRLLVVLNKSINFIIPLLVMFATLSTYLRFLSMDQKLILVTASVVFTSLAIFDGMLRQEIRRVMDRISDLTQGQPSSSTCTLPRALSARDDDGRIGFRDAQFSWSSQVNDNDFKLRIGSEVIFQPGVINLIVGPTGVGKTAVLLSLLGEMHFNPAGPNPWVNLPRQGGVAYAPQQPWIENATIKQNIVFDTSVPFDETRYKRVLHACALYPDLELLDARDETEARVSLARAIYSTASTIILDDVLSSLDIHTAKWVVKNCLSSDLVQGRTVILVTHNIALTRPISQWVVSLNSDGSIVQGSVETVLKASHLPAADLEEEQKALEQDEKSGASDISSGPKGKLMVAEQMEQGMVKWHTCKSRCFFSPFPVMTAPISDKVFLGNFSLILALFVLNEATTSFQFWFLGYWSSQYLDHPASSVPVPFYLAIYSLSGLLAMVFYIVPYILYAFWHDAHRKDNPRQTHRFCRWHNIKMAGYYAHESGDHPTHPGYKQSGRQFCRKVQRLHGDDHISAARSPMLAHFAAAISGLTSIRAYGAEEAFLRESTVRINNFLQPAISFWNLNRWISMRSEILGGAFSAALGWYLVYGGGVHRGPANVGFSLSAAVLFSSTILSWVRITNALQLDPTTEPSSLERIVQYLGIEQEPKPTQAGVPPAYWPASGEIRAENLSAKYSTDSPEILHRLNFAIKSGERIAIVGRTGSGKSSLTLALLRSIPTEGKIYYDGIPIDSLNLDALRSSITIIPQVPELLGGTLRRNLDPFEAHEDSVLNDALRAAGLFSLQTDKSHSLSLDSLISSEGGNLSLGERQIVAFARAIVRGSKLLILDEDHETDVIIQSTVRNELKSVSVLTVAHRLQTVMDYDRIMVLEAGHIIELDTPSNLLKDKAGYLRAMVDESSDRE